MQLVLLLGVVLCFFTGQRAERLGYSPLLWYAAGLFFALPALIVIWSLPDLQRTEWPSERVDLARKVGNAIGLGLVVVGVAINGLYLLATFL